MWPWAQAKGDSPPLWRQTLMHRASMEISHKEKAGQWSNGQSPKEEPWGSLLYHSLVFTPFFLHFLHSVLEGILEGSGFQCNSTKIYGSGRKCNLQKCQDFKTLKLLKMQSSLSDWAKEIFAHCWTVTGCGWWWMCPGPARAYTFTCVPNSAASYSGVWGLAEHPPIMRL